MRRYFRWNRMILVCTESRRDLLVISVLVIWRFLYIFDGKITNNIYQIIYWCPKALFETKHLQKLSKNVCSVELWAKVWFFSRYLNWQVRENGNKVKDDEKYLIWQKKATRIQMEEYSCCQYSYLYWGKIDIQKRFGSQKHQEKYCNCRSPVSLLVWRKTTQRARTPTQTPQNNETRSPPTVKTFHFKNLRDKQRKQKQRIRARLVANSPKWFVTFNFLEQKEMSNDKPVVSSLFSSNS